MNVEIYDKEYKFWIQKRLGQQIVCPKRSLGNKDLESKQNFWFRKIWGPRQVLVKKKMLGPFNIGWGSTFRDTFQTFLIHLPNTSMFRRKVLFLFGNRAKIAPPCL